MNRYYKSKLEITADIAAIMVGKLADQTPRDADGFVIIKLRKGDNENHKCLEGWEEIKDVDLTKEFEKEPLKYFESAIVKHEKAGNKK